MTADLRELLQEARAELESLHEATPALQHLLDALAEKAPEPVAWMMYDESKRIPLICHLEPSNRHLVDAFPVYRAVPPTASQDDARDAARWRYGLSDPKGMAHLWRLLADGKGTAESLDTMMDRIMKSRDAAIEREGGA